MQLLSDIFGWAGISLVFGAATYVAYYAFQRGEIVLGCIVVAIIGCGFVFLAAMLEPA